MTLLHVKEIFDRSVDIMAEVQQIVTDVKRLTLVQKQKLRKNMKSYNDFAAFARTEMNEDVEQTCTKSRQITPLNFTRTAGFFLFFLFLFFLMLRFCVNSLSFLKSMPACKVIKKQN